MPVEADTTFVVAVVADHAAHLLTDCLDGVRALEPVPAAVVVVDFDSDDGTADVAIGHPVVDRVLVMPPGQLDRVLDVATLDGDHRFVLVLPGDRRPSPDWASTALRALRDAAVVFGADADLRHAGIDRVRVGHLELFRGASTTDEVAARVRASGHAAAVVDGLHLDPAAVGQDLSGRRPATGAARISRGARPEMVSVVVCTRDRPDHLDRCLRSLESLVDPCHEVLVVDNNDVPSVELGGDRPRWRTLHERRRGLDVARNRGLNEARGSIVAFIDDDCEADPHWITNLRATFADPSVDAVTGRVRAASLEQPSQRWFESHFSFDRGTVATRFTPWDKRPWYPVWAGCIGTGCNMAFRKHVLQEVGGFDELLDMGTAIGGGGDLDLYARLIDAGAIIAYTPDALVWHHHRATERDVTTQFRGYGLSVGALVAKTMIERPEHRMMAVRFFLDRLRVAMRLSRQSRAGTHIVPPKLLILDVAAQCLGPFVYLQARWRTQRRAAQR